MDFHAARRMFESNALAAESAPPRPTPKTLPASSPASPAAQARRSLAPAPPPVLPGPTPSPPPPPQQQPPGSNSDYSDVGDYAADTEFYVPDVNDSNLELAQRKADPLLPDAGATVFSAVTGPRGSSASASGAAEWTVSSNRRSIRVEERLESETEASLDVVRQHSNFSQLSAQSWLTVDSAQDLAEEEEGRVYEQGGGSHVQQSGPDNRNSFADDRDPATLFGIDVGSELMDEVQSKSIRNMTVFECCAVLQAGVAAYKKKSFRRFGARRVWLSADCDRLFWTSKKDGVNADHIKLQKVAKMKCVDREVCIDVTEGYRLWLLFANADEAGLWVRALSCRIPLQARIRAPKGMVLPDKEREDYTLTDDVFNGRPLREYTAVNSYVVLCSAKGQPKSLGNKLAFSRSDGSFCGLRYVPNKHVPHMLRSPEEVAVLKRLNHPNVVKYHECLLDAEYGGNYVIFEHLARGSLTDSSRLEGVKPTTERATRELIRDVLRGLEYLHSLRIAHGDIRPDNLLRAVNGAVKINAIGCITHDFTEIKNAHALTRVRLGDASPAFLAPEQCWLSEAPAAHAKNYAMDVWSVAVVIYFMLYGRVPFGGRDDAAIQESICKGKLRFPRYPETSRKVRSLIKGVLAEKDPKTRIPLTELQNHPWFIDNEEADGVFPDDHLPARLIVSPEEVDSAVQVARVRVSSVRS